MLPYKVHFLLSLKKPLTQKWVGLWVTGWGQLSEPHPTHPDNGTRVALSGGSRVPAAPSLRENQPTYRWPLRTQAWPGNQEPWVPTLAPVGGAVCVLLRVHMPLTCTASASPLIHSRSGSAAPLTHTWAHSRLWGRASGHIEAHCLSFPASSEAWHPSCPLTRGSRLGTARSPAGLCTLRGARGPRTWAH